MVMSLLQLNEISSWIRFLSWEKEKTTEFGLGELVVLIWARLEILIARFSLITFSTAYAYSEAIWKKGTYFEIVWSNHKNMIKMKSD